MITLDRKIAFNAMRKAPLFAKGYQQSQVDGLNFLFDVWERTYQDRTPIVQFANVLGQTYLETGATMRPIHEYGNRDYFMRMYDKTGDRPNVAKMLGNTEVGDGARYPGMGYIQSTGRANAIRNTRKLRALGIIGPDVDFEKTPELMMKPEYAVHIMFLGMEEGWFTGTTLDQTIDPKIDGDEHADFIKARAIINGSNKAALIADYSDAFLGALKVAQRVGTPPTAPVKPPVVEEKPAEPVAEKKGEPPAPPAVPTPENPAPKGWFEHLMDVLRSGRK